MKELFSNPWVTSIISGFLVFFITNSIDKKKSKKQIYNANKNLINNLNDYIVNDGLPQEEIINAIKSSIAREYGIKNADLFSTKTIFEELINGIINNTYISNDNKKKYISMLQEEMKKDINMDNNNFDNKSSLINSSVIASIVAGIVTFLMPWIMALIKGSDETFSISIIIPLEQTGIAIIFTVVIILSIKLLNSNNKTRQKILNKLNKLPKTQFSNINSSDFDSELESDSDSESKSDSNTQ